MYMQAFNALPKEEKIKELLNTSNPSSSP